MRLFACLALVLLLLAGCAKKDPAGTGTQGSEDPCAGIEKSSLGMSNASNPAVAIRTKQGCMAVELFQDKAPITVANFLAYTDSGFYDNTLIHRISKEFVLQGGSIDAGTGKAKTGLRPPIKNEGRTSGLHNEAYTFAMARTSSPDSATSQFFINVKDNRACLDAVTGTCDPARNGYAVFAKVVRGTDVVDALHGLPVTTSNAHPYCLSLEDGSGGSCPVDPVAIQSVRRL